MESVNEKMAREYQRVKGKKMTLDPNKLQDMMRSGSILPGVALAQDMPNVGRKKLTPSKKFIDYEGGAIDWSKGNIDLMSRMYPSVEITIDTPTQNQEIPSDEDVVISFNVTTDTQNYIYAIALVVDGVEVEKRTPYSTDDFTIAAGTLSVDSHNIILRAYDVNNEVVYNSQAVSVDVVASFSFDNALVTDGVDDFVQVDTNVFQEAQKLTIVSWFELRDSNDIFQIELQSPDLSERFAVNISEGLVVIFNRTSENAGNRYRDGNAPISVGKQQSVVVFDGTESEVEDMVKLYVNSIQIHFPELPAATPTAISSIINKILIGTNTVGHFPCKYNRQTFDVGYAATQQDAIDLYANGNGANYESVTGRKPIHEYKGDIQDGDTVWVDHGSEGVNGVLNNFSTPPPYVESFNV